MALLPFSGAVAAVAEARVRSVLSGPERGLDPPLCYELAVVWPPPSP